MKRWHEERDLMMRRWRKELGKHGSEDRHSVDHWGGPYDYVAPPSWAASVSCHCAAGIGTMRKNRLDCGQARCGLCHPYLYDPKRRGSIKRNSIAFDLRSSGDEKMLDLR